MKANVIQFNLILAWLWIVLGFVFGFVLGLNFDRTDWLGGYASWRRRLYRLSHISFFGLAFINLLFYFTARGLDLSSLTTRVAAGGFMIGALTMPACCVVMAHRPAWRALFLIPVLSLTTSGMLTLWEITKL